MRKTNYVGDNIAIEEMPQGCVITQNGKTIVVASNVDARLIIDSLCKMIGASNEKPCVIAGDLPQGYVETKEGRLINLNHLDIK